MANEYKGYIYISDEDYARAAANGISKRVLQSRLRVQGWPLEKSVTQPLRVWPGLGEEWYQLAEKNGICRQTFANRVGGGWSKEKAATTSKEEAQKNKHNPRKVLTAEEEAIAAQNGISLSKVFYRLRHGWAREDALTIPHIPPGERKKRGREIAEAARLKRSEET